LESASTKTLVLTNQLTVNLLWI